MDEIYQVWTHSVKCFDNKLNGKKGTYRISYEKMKLKIGDPRSIYFIWQTRAVNKRWNE